MLPSTGRLLSTVAGLVGIEEPVGCSIVAVKLVHLPQSLELPIESVDFIGRGVAVVVPKDAQQGCSQLWYSISPCHRLQLGELWFGGSDSTSPAVDHSINAAELACRKESQASSHAEPNHADLAAVIGLRLEECDASSGVI